MTKPPSTKLSKNKSLSVQVKMHDEHFFRRMLGIVVNPRDGGVIVTPLLENWESATCSALAVTPTGGLLPEVNSYVTTGPDNRPKLHYHRSGMSSVQPAKFQGGEGRRTIHLPALDELDGVQIFSVTARLPALLPTTHQVKTTDVVIIMDRSDVRSLYLAGVIYDRSRVPAESIGGLREGEPLFLASGSRITAFVDLSGYGVEAILGLHFNPTEQALPDFAADFSLVSFHSGHMHSQGAVAIHAGQGTPLPAIMAPIPPVSEIHRVNNIRASSSTLRNSPPRHDG